MADNLDEIFGKTEEIPPVPPLDSKVEEQKKLDDEVLNKQTQLENLNKAVLEANETLKKTRKAIKQPDQVPQEEELPKIDMNDPGSKAWSKHINEQVSPIQAELDKEKQEIRQFALKRFLEDKPNLISSPEGLKKVMETYDKIKTASERTVEGVLIDLDKAYAAENYEEILSSANQQVSSKARADEAFSEIAISRGSTAYPNQKKTHPKLSEADVLQLAKWGQTEEEFWKLKEKYG